MKTKKANAVQEVSGQAEVTVKNEKSIYSITTEIVGVGHTRILVWKDAQNEPRSYQVNTPDYERAIYGKENKVEATIKFLESVGVLFL